MATLKKMIEIAKDVQNPKPGSPLDYPFSKMPGSIDSDVLKELYPELTIHQAVLIDCYIVERAMGIPALLDAMRECARLINPKRDNQ